MLEMLFPLMIISLIGGVIFFAILRNDLLRNRKVGIIGLCVSIAIFVSIMLYGIFGTPYNVAIVAEKRCLRMNCAKIVGIRW